MSQADFVHLHNHSMYSLLDGAIKIDDMLKTVTELGMKRVAITDHGNLFGALDFYTKAIKAGIIPIVGIETYIVPYDLHEKGNSPGVPDSGYHLVLLAKNFEGYSNLIKLSSIAYLEGFYYKPRIDKKILKEYSNGLIALSACLRGEVASAVITGGEKKAEGVIRGYLDIFNTDDFFLEIQNHDIAEEATVRAAFRKLAPKFGVGLVATNDCHYLKKEHHTAHDALLCLQTGKVISDTDRMRYQTDQFYFKSAEQMKELFANAPEAIENTVKIADKCSLEIDLGRNLVPEFPLPERFKTTDEYIEHITLEGLKNRYKDISSSLTERLDYELKVIKQMGYSGYFLIVKDFIDFAREHDIRVGPGRGSAAGSLVSYCLGITNIDPIKYNLLFERFLNPERISMPDIDIDFADRGRDRVIEYVTDRYGRENVAQIITFGTMAARAVVRDVGRVHSVPYTEMDRVAKMIPEETGMTLERALEISGDLKEKVQQDEKIATVIEHSKILEGLARHASTHAAGVVIAPGPLTDYVPLYKSSKDEITTQFDMRIIEKIGLLKMDFLGLRTLTVIDDTLELIKNTRQQEIDINAIPLDDPDVYRIFSEGKTVGIFQFESGGMRDYLRKLGPTCIDDLIAMNALYRPGPLDSGMIDTYIECKKGKKKIKYEHPLLEPILKDTYGVIVFQEQVLKIAQEMAGYSLGSADILRKAMGKKQAEVMARQKSDFIEGAVRKKIDKKIAEKVFDMIETFARYGFVKAHSTGYAVIAYQTAYLKTHYPAEFMAAALTNEMGNSNRVTLFKNECRELGIDILPPDINEGLSSFSVVDNKITFGLAAVKNVGTSAVESIVTAREKDGKFTDIFDFCNRIDNRTVNKKALESLIASGALDCIDPFRAKLYKNVDLLISYSSRMHKEAQSGQSSLFGQDDSEGAIIPTLKETTPWGDTKTRNMEKDVLGFYLSSHPLEDELLSYSAFIDHELEDLVGLKDESSVLVGGVICEKPEIKTSRKNNLFAIFKIEDLTESIEVIIFSDCLEKRKSLLTEGNNVLVAGTVDTKEGEKPKIKGNDLWLLKTAYKEIPCSLSLGIEQSQLDNGKLEETIKLFEENPGASDVLLRLRTERTKLLVKSKKFKVECSPALLKGLADRFGKDNIKLKVKKDFVNGKKKGWYQG